MIRAAEMKIVSAQAPFETENQVNKFLKEEAWTLHGDLKVAVGASGNLTYVQALVKIQIVEPPGTSPLALGGGLMLRPG